jgi:hypothetical protein
MKIKNILNRKYDSLSSDEKEFYENNREKYELNICDKTNVICYSNEMVWNVLGYDAISIETYEELIIN